MHADLKNLFIDEIGKLKRAINKNHATVQLESSKELVDKQNHLSKKQNELSSLEKDKQIYALRTGAIVNLIQYLKEENNKLKEKLIQLDYDALVEK